jgi:hypothetical protein
MATRSDLSGPPSAVVSEINKLIQDPYALFIVFGISQNAANLADKADILTGEEFSPKKVVYITGADAIAAVKASLKSTLRNSSGSGLDLCDPMVAAVVTSLDDEIVLAFSDLPLKNTQIARAWYAALAKL